MTWFINEHIFQHPFNCIIAAPTMGGKTEMIKQILKHKNMMIVPNPTNIIYCYKVWQTNYDVMKLNDNSILFNEGVYDFTRLKSKENNLVILDDLMTEVINDPEILNLFTVGMHHTNTSVFFLTQNIFSKGKFSRDLSLNTNYIINFKNPRDQLQFQVLARQIYGNKSKFLLESFRDATKNPYGYIFLDLKQETDYKNRVQTGILPYQKRVIYTQK
jgi:hypothetical protein